MNYYSHSMEFFIIEKYINLRLLFHNQAPHQKIKIHWGDLYNWANYAPN